MRGRSFYKRCCIVSVRRKVIPDIAIVVLAVLGMASLVINTVVHYIYGWLYDGAHSVEAVTDKV
jgi:hypothetical protein